ncbi:MAG: 3-deoxy-8-phosphooctulonate synthase [Alphaproteobacteria bacterium]|jgi:2-dehydro-3-deoxyphosphooctonate aldolase (KDO 8-P synthase)|nr:3-deoxy-8-phosphooctulonate synthase [Alphaproteobacteria bacterium]PPR12690.1 MAG: 2-dehydro-3-deoxyphosphooctonate aldolase [Alphaproteobacteria bacterium MarineAlpha12_Bin1]|tara:strand:+ start:413 stop:1267 length:855 start_codon:yes stop_codon:yes gene_type:complete
MAKHKRVKIGNYVLGNDLPLKIIAGPCQIESRSHALEMSSALLEISQKCGVEIIYKSSFDKANRTSLSSIRGLGLEECLPIFSEIREVTGLPVLTDVHETVHCSRVSNVVDVIQIPAFLCRQTDLIVAAANTGCVLNIKKGQFLAPWDMLNVVSKALEAGNENVLVCERGSSFGYNTLVSDMRSIPIMADQTNCPIVFDATHSVQQPGGLGKSSGGQREFAPVLARAAVAVGVSAVFVETHEDPDNAPSDGPNMLRLKELPGIIETLIEIDEIAKKNLIDINKK